jgi:hypothetical protein
MSDARALRSAFLGNAAFSLLSGVAFILLADPLAQLSGLAAGWPFRIVGIGLLPFGAWLVWLSRRPRLTARIGKLISVLDAQWVIGTIVLLTVWPELFNATGQTIALGIAAVVASFAIWQMIGAGRLASAT